MLYSQIVKMILKNTRLVPLGIPADGDAAMQKEQFDANASDVKLIHNRIHLMIHLKTYFITFSVHVHSTIFVFLFCK